MATIRVARGRNIIEIPAENLSAARDRGYTQISDQEAQRAVDVSEAATVTGGAIGATEAVARGVSFGTTDTALRAMGADTKKMAARAEGMGSKAFELVGAIAPAILSGGAGAIGTAARLTPAARVAMLGRGVARGVESAAGTSVLARVGAGAAAGAAEGAFAGAGGALTEAALGDTDIAAERLLAGAKDGAGLGALFGAGTTTLGLGLEHAYSGGQKVSKGLVGKALGSADDAGSASGQAAAAGDSVLGRMVRLQTKAIGGGEAHAAAASRALARTRTAEGRAMLDLVGRPSSVVDDAMGHRMSSSVGGSSPSTAISTWERNFSQSAKSGHRGASATRDQLDSWLTTARKDHASAGLTAPLSEGAVARARKILRSGKNEMTASPAAAHRWMSRASTEIDDLVGQLRVQGSADYAGLEAMARPLRAMVDDAATWGPKGSRAVYAAQNAEREALESVSSKTRKALLGQGRRAPGPLARESEGVARVLDARAKVADSLEHVGEDVSELRRGIDKLRSDLNYRDEVGAVAADSRMLIDLEHGPGVAARGLIKRVGEGTGALLGGLSFGGAVLGRMAGSVMASATQPARAIRVIARARGGIDAVRARQGAAVVAFDSMASGAGRVARRVGRGGSSAARRVSPIVARKKTRRKQERLIETIRRVGALASDPEALAEEMGTATRELRTAAPDVSDALMAGSARAAAYLASVSPEIYSPTFGGKVEMVDRFELEAFGRKVEAVEDPMGTLDRLAKGSLTLDHTEAIASVYPKIFAEFQDQIMEVIGKREAAGDPVSFTARTAMGMLADLVTDDSMRPADYGMIQASMASGDPEQPQQPPAQPDVEPPPLSKWQRMEASS